MTAEPLYDGKLIVLEGLDGSGKSGLLKSLIKSLRARFPEKTIFSAKEPGHTVLGEEIRTILLEPKRASQDCPTSLTEALLFNAARSQLIETVLIPQLASGAWIFLDRFTLSTSAYQRARGGIRDEFLEILLREVCAEIVPTLTLFLKVPWFVCKKRLLHSRRGPDRIESYSDDFFNQVSKNYDEAIKNYPFPIALLNAQLSKKCLLDKALNLLMPYLTSTGMSA